MTPWLLKTILVIVCKALICLSFCLYISLFYHILNVVSLGFIENIVKNGIFNPDFFIKHPLILKNGPTWLPGSFKFRSGYF